MKYKTRINFADSFDVYDVAEADAPIISNVKLKDSTSLDSNITIGSAVSKMLSFTLNNAPVEVFDGQRLTLYGQLDEDMTPDVDFTEYELTDEQVLNDLFEPVNDDIPDGGIEFTPEEVAAIEESFAQDGETDTYEIPFEDETDNDFVETGDNDVYREDDISAEDVGDATEEDEDYISFGEFYITNIQVVGDEYNIQALDGFILMNSKYVPTNNVDTVENMYNDFRTQLNNLTGIETNEEEEYPDLTIIWDYDTTYREAAGYFAGLLGGYATFDRYGALDIRQYMKNNTLSIIDTDIVDLQLNSDSIVFIQGMICDTDITALTNYVKTSADAEDYWTINFTNPFMTQTILNNIYTTYYENLEYTPAKAVLDWTDGIQAGDLINIEDNWILITNQTIDFASGTTTIDSLGTTATLSEGQITDPMVRKMQRTQSNLKSSVQIAQEIAQEADLMATATNQHFWSTTDGIYYLSEDTTVDTSKEYFSKSGDTYTRVTPIGTENPVTEGWYERLGAGAYVTEVSQDEFNDPESTNYHSGKNSLWNSAGMLFRNGLRRLLAIVTGDTTGVAIYDGQGNDTENVVASFTDSGSVIGKYGGSRTIVGNNYISMINSEGVETFRINNAGGNKYQQEVNESYFIYVNKQRPQTATLFNNAIPPDGESFGIDGLRSDGSGASPSIDFNFWFYAGTPETKSQTFTLNNGNGTITIAYDGSRGIEVSLSATEEFDALITKTSFVVFSDAPAFTLGSRTKNQQMGANSLTVGTDLYTDAQNSVVVGQYNAGTTGVSFFTVGCGTSDDVSERANALDVRGYGSFNETVITGVLEVRKRQYKNLDTGGDILAEGNITANNHVVGITETGTTSNNWDYRLWSDGTYEAWRSHGFTGMALTSSSAGTYYGGGTTLGVPTFPNNSNTGVTQCLCTASNAFSHSSGVYLYQTEHASATTATSNLTFQFRAHASTSNAACGLDIYLKGTYS